MGKLKLMLVARRKGRGVVPSLIVQIADELVADGYHGDIEYLVDEVENRLQGIAFVCKETLAGELFLQKLEGVQLTANRLAEIIELSS